MSGEVGGTRVDLGGQWLTAGQHRLVALAAELGVGTVEHRRRGRSLMAEDAGFVTKLAGAFAQRRALRAIEALARAVPAGEPMAGSDAAALDRVSLAAWLDQHVRHDLARERLLLHADLVFARDPAALSLLSYVSILGATGGFQPTGADLPGGGREHRFEGGADRLALRLLEDRGELDLHAAHPVASIEDTGARVVARGYFGEHAARRVVLAIPPRLVAELAIDLPPAQRAYVDGVRVGGVVKCFAAYPRAFWRDRGLSGELYVPRGSVRATVDASTGGAGVLCAFVVGDAAARWAARDPAERRGEVIAILTEHFGDEAARPVDYLEHDWAAERWSAGCVASTPPGVLARGARWREPHGNVHFAGTETAVAWPGYMDGAIEAGERAAAEVIAALA